MSLETRLARVEAQLGDDGGGGCPTCTGVFGPWRPAPPSPCPACGRGFTVQDFTLDLFAAIALDREGSDR